MTIPELSYSDGLNLAQTLTPAQRACRLAGSHRFPDVDHPSTIWLDVKRWKYYQVYLECERGCGVQKDVQVDYDGFIIGTAKMIYKDADGYLLKGAYMGGEARAALRRDAIERRGVLTTTATTAPRSKAPRHVVTSAKRRRKRA